MSRKKIDTEVKIRIVEQYLKGELSQTAAAKMCHVHIRSVQDWIRIYKTEGAEGLQEKQGCRHYPKEVKLHAVQDYLAGIGSLDDICVKYGIRQHSQILYWIKVYNEGKELKELTGGTSMKKAKKTTYEERLLIVKDCLAHDQAFKKTALKYGCSYEQVRNWVIRYKKMGEAGLEDRRGKRIGSLPARTPEEELRDRIAKLEKENKELQVENDLLKKVRELERGNRCL